MQIIGVAEVASLRSMGVVTSNLEIMGKFFALEFHVMKQDFYVRTDGILGSDFLFKYGANIDYSKCALTLRLPEDKAERENSTEQRADEVNISGPNGAKKSKNAQYYEKLNREELRQKYEIIEPKAIEIRTINALRGETAYEDNGNPKKKMMKSFLQITMNASSI